MAWYLMWFDLVLRVFLSVAVHLVASKRWHKLISGTWQLWHRENNDRWKSPDKLYRSHKANYKWSRSNDGYCGTIIYKGVKFTVLLQQQEGAFHGGGSRSRLWLAGRQSFCQFDVGWKPCLWGKATTTSESDISLTPVLYLVNGNLHV